MAIIFAFCCIFCSAMNDFVFKLFARKPRSRGLFVFMIGVAWAAASSFLPDLRGASWNTTILWGIISGLFSVIGNLLLIEAMGKQSAGLCSTIYRLNLALVVPGAWILFKEQNSLLQCIGIAAAFAAVLFFLPGSKNPNSDTSPRDAKLGLILVIIAAILRAGMGLAYKYGFNLGASANGVNLVNAFCWIAGGPVYYFLRERNLPELGAFSKKLTGYGILSGIFVFGIVFFMAHSVRLGNASIVLPIMQMSFVVTFILSAVFLKEKLTLYKFIALSCGAAALLCLSIK
ncbi:MAG: EamA family transporter [Lentisphaeria bacterium]|nr:EamA family transporter [Lentisphaeria bacterium]